MKLITINIGGVCFTTTQETLQAVPNTRLSSLTETSPEFIAEKGFFYFDRNPDLFNYVLDYYRTGELHLPKNMCGAAIRNELEYWTVEAGHISECCLSSLFQFEDELEVTHQLKEQFEDEGFEYSQEELNASKVNRVKNAIWLFLDKANSSRAAKVFGVFYFVMVLVTCITFILESHPLFRWERLEPDSSGTGVVSMYTKILASSGNPKIALFLGTDEYFAIYLVNIICKVFFTMELFFHFICCPKKLLFFKNFLNAIDLIIVVAMWIAFILEEIFRAERNEDTKLLWVYLVAKGCIILRLLRLFRLAKYYSGLKVLFLALKASLRELGLLLLTFMIATALFAGLIYYAEFTEPTTFPNVPIAIWWAIITLTTVGYGDFVPKDPIGYVVGGVGSICGLLLLSMPIAIIATNFNDYYSRNKIREKQRNLKKDLFSKLRKLFTKRPAIRVAVAGDPTSNGEATRAANAFKRVLNKGPKAPDKGLKKPEAVDTLTPVQA